jgi:hypothetical protein
MNVSIYAWARPYGVLAQTSEIAFGMNASMPQHARAHTGLLQRRCRRILHPPIGRNRQVKTSPHCSSPAANHVDRHPGVIFIDLSPNEGRGPHTHLHRLLSSVDANYNSMLLFVYINKLLPGKADNQDISSLDELNHASDSTRSISPRSYTIIIKPHYHVGVAFQVYSYVIRFT